MDCVGNEYNASPARDKISDFVLGMAQITAAVQGRVADQQQPFSIFNPRHLASQSSRERLVQAFYQIHPSLQQFVIGQILLRPAIQHLVQSLSLSASELLIA